MLEFSVLYNVKKRDFSAEQG